MERKTEQTSGGYHRPREHRSEGHCSPTEPSFVSYKGGGGGGEKGKGTGKVREEDKPLMS